MKQGLCGVVAAFSLVVAATTCGAQEKYVPTPSFDLSSMDTKADPCNDFYQYTCGKYAANHPIPADQGASDGFYNLFNVNTQALSGILTKAAAGGSGRSANEQKIGDYFAACMDKKAINAKGLTPLNPLLKQIDAMDFADLASVTGELQRIGVNVLFSYGEQQDFKDASKQIASLDQGGLGMPEKDYYLRSGAKDEELRKGYVALMKKLLALSGETQERAAKDASAVMAFETELAKLSQGVVDRRDPEKVYHLMPFEAVDAMFPEGTFAQFQDAIVSPRVTEMNVTNPDFVKGMIALVTATDLTTLRAYYRVHLLASEASQLPDAFDQAVFDFYGTQLSGTKEQRARNKRCSSSVDSALGEALGEVYVKQYFAGDSKKKMLEMVADLENAMGRDINQLDWMSAETKVKAQEKLHMVANKIGYPDKFRDYAKLEVKRDDALGNRMRGAAFENDRQLAKIGKPVDHNEWGMTPPTVNAYYDPSMNDINFPAGILQPNFYDPKADDAINYGHIGAVIGHELTHGFDDEGKKFDGKGNLSDWWTAEDTKKFEAKTDCLVKEYDKFVAVDDVHVQGKLTLGENTADNGGMLIAYMAYMDRAKTNHENLNTKVSGFTAPQRFFIAYAQNWCSNDRPESLRSGALQDPHSPNQFRVVGPIVNQPAFGAAFSCKAGAKMVPVNSCRVW
jgi:putative endopeptidase